jgi:hypothetical protein
VSTISFGSAGGPTIAANIEKARGLLAQACAAKPDIVCLPETFPSMGVPGVAADLALPLPGPASEMAADMARQHHCYVICPFLEKRVDAVYNDAVLIDRQGQIMGAYRKAHPVTQTADYTSLEDGVTPGFAPRTFDTDFGRIGILICFDLMYPAEWAALKAQGAELVFWPSAYNGGFPLQVQAGLHHYYIATAVQKDRPRFVDITGRLLLEGDRYSPILTATLDLEKGLYHTDFNASQLPAIRARYGADLTIRSYADDGAFTLESNRADLSVAQVEAEFGLERLDKYLARNQAARDVLREGKAPAPQQTPYLDHPEWV